MVDEEHDPAYKQEDGVRYHARDMAVVRARENRIPVVLASATPSVESEVNARRGRYAHLRLPERFGGQHDRMYRRLRMSIALAVAGTLIVSLAFVLEKAFYAP